jgi:hypothetical protein
VPSLSSSSRVRSLLPATEKEHRAFPCETQTSDDSASHNKPGSVHPIPSCLTAHPSILIDFQPPRHPMQPGPRSARAKDCGGGLVGAKTPAHPPLPATDVRVGLNAPIIHAPGARLLQSPRLTADRRLLLCRVFAGSKFWRGRGGWMSFESRGGSL